MTEIVIRDVPIRFPFKPYKVQEDYMSKVLECLQKGVNGVLESPTGTGKTLSLLCASLAWLQTKKAQAQASAQGLLLGSDAQQAFGQALQSELQKSTGSAIPAADTPWSNRLDAPQIIYASRTHAQLTQVVKELKRSSYSHVKAAVLGSRDQLCIHPDLAEEQGFMKVMMCRAKLSAHSCHLNSNLESKKSSLGMDSMEVMDIEDLAQRGTKEQVCPYYLARELMAVADIVFMPYNYLLNPQTRQQQRVTLHNTVVILDEAHNVENMCEESASVRITSTDIALCIGEVTEVMKTFSERQNNEFNDDTDKDFSLEDLCVLKTLFLKLETVIDEIELGAVKERIEKGKICPGSYIFDLLAKAEIDLSKMAVIDGTLTSVAQFLSTTSSSPLSRKGTSLLRFGEFLHTVFRSCGEKGDTKQCDLFYKVFIEPEVPKKSKPDSWSSTKTSHNYKAKVVNFWCFSPGFAMQSLLAQGVHCVILTSGTLSPIHTTVSELAIPIPVTLENPHIIQSNQVGVLVLKKGPTNEPLLSSFANRDNPKYLSDLGRILTNICRVTPDGVLVFFSSYPNMEKAVAHWQTHGIWSQINVLKPLFVEPQRRDVLADVMNHYAAALDTVPSRGAVLLAVLRGKVSEGMDFANRRCRAVVVTGIPYPPMMDPRVILKREYMDDLRKTNPKGLSGGDWYQLEAVRAVNQAVGRVIRHSADYGIVLLCDQRFAMPTISRTLSAWLRPYITCCEQFGPAYRHVSQFFKAIGDNPPVRPEHVGASFGYVDVKVRTKDSQKDNTQKSENKDVSLNQFLEKIRQTQPKPLQPSPSGLFEAIDASSSQKKTADILKAVCNNPEEVKDSYVRPAPKRRKLKYIPVQFNPTDVTTSTSTTENTKTPLEYLQEVKSRLTKENFAIFKDVVKKYAYSKDPDYKNTVICLRKVFPDERTKDLFIGFKRYVLKDDKKKFETLCLKLFNSTT